MSEYLPSLILALIIYFTIGLIKHSLTKEYQYLWLAKCFVTLPLMLFYEYAYTDEAYTYYLDYERFEMGTQSLLTAGTYFTNDIVQALKKIIPINNSFHIIKLIFSFIGFLGSILIYTAFRQISGQKDRFALFLICLFPSLIFWSSTMGKEPLILFAIGCFLLFAVKLYNSRYIKSLLPLSLSIILFYNLRIWMLFILSTALLLTQALNQNAQKTHRVLCLSVVSLLAFIVYKYFSFTDSEQFLATINAISSAWNKGGSSLTPPEFHSLWDILAFLPLGAFTSLFRPLPFELSGVLSFLSGAESLMLLGLFILAFKNFGKNIFNQPVAIYLIITIFLWSLFYGFLSYQNLGTAVRFRMQIIPFILLLYLFSIRFKSCKHP